ncbi:MAG: type II toxin-antitoxin system PemK/MazF family toxin [Micrococcales bacterium]|nr:type II toxin-antitoxin system PemK/MazF family toxin [Micrococcales bacterium]
MRGDLFRLPTRHDARGHEQRGPRYGVVVQSDDLLLSTVLVAPTSRSAAPASFRPVIDVNGTETRILPEQTRAIDTQRLGDFAGRLTASELTELDRAYHDVLDLFR